MRVWTMILAVASAGAALAQTPTFEDGRFQLEGLRPGKYRLYAWEEFEAGAQSDPNVTAPFQARSVAIEVAEGERKEVAVTRISVEEVAQAPKPLR